MNPDYNAAPINPLPPVVWVLVVPLVLVELGFSAGARGLIGGTDAVGWRLDAIQTFAFFPELARRMLETGQYAPRNLIRLVSYLFVHGSFTHALFTCVFILALGKMVGEVFRAWAVLAVFGAAGIAGALAYMAVPVPASGMVQPLFGAYPGVYGLIGAFTYLLWQDLAAKGANKYRAFSLIGFLLATQLLFGVLFGGGWDWVADIAGFVAGFVLSIPLAPGGWRVLVGRMRRR